MPLANLPPCKSEHAGCVKLTKHQRVVHDYPPPRALQSFRAKLPDPLNPRTSLDAKRVPTALHSVRIVSSPSAAAPFADSSGSRVSSDFHNAAMAGSMPVGFRAQWNHRRAGAADAHNFACLTELECAPDSADAEALVESWPTKIASSIQQESAGAARTACARSMNASAARAPLAKRRAAS